MPVPASHTDFSVVVSGNSVHVIGGQIYKHPEHFRLRLTDLIQTYMSLPTNGRSADIFPTD